ncbi:UNVERIFIED_CONTAM: GTP-binding protein [Kocuria sp. CPCC 205274]
MHLVVVSSLDALSRQQACESLAHASPGAVVLVQDLLDDGAVLRRTVRSGGPAERVTTPLEHACPSCAVRLDLVPALERLREAGEEHVVVGLPPGVPTATATRALRSLMDAPPTVDAAVLACAPASVEDQIWDGQTLAEAGCATVDGDERTPGEFLVGELAFNDTVLLADPDLLPVGAEERARGVGLLRELARHADLVEHGAEVRPGRRRPAEALHRAASGCLEPSRGAPSSPFTTVVHRVERPLHPERFQHALSALAAGCCWLRGHVCLAVAPEYRVLVQGIGPRVWLENTGPWPVEQRADPRGAHRVPPGPGEHATVLAATGEDLDATEMTELLASCQLTEAEMRSGITGLADPFGISSPS